MSRFSVEISFDEMGPSHTAGDTLTGTVRIDAHKDCECRKLELIWELQNEKASEGKTIQLEPVTVAKWLTWQSSETYTYPITFTPPPFVGSSQESYLWSVQAIVHVVGDFQPTTTDWQPVRAPSDEEPLGEAKEDAIASPAEILEEADDQVILPQPQANAEESLMPSDRASFEEPPLDAASTTSGLQLKIEFDKPDRRYWLGEKWIGGTLTVVADRDYRLQHVGVRREWRTHGRTEREAGGSVTSTLAGMVSWRAGERYLYRFDFPINRGPTSIHGHSHSLDWYLRPVLEFRDGDAPMNLEQTMKAAEEDFLLYASRLTARIDSSSSSNRQARTGKSDVSPRHVGNLSSRLVSTSFLNRQVKIDIEKVNVPLDESWIVIVSAFLGSTAGLITLFATEIDTLILGAKNGVWWLLGAVGVLLALMGWAVRVAVSYKLAELRIGPVDIQVTPGESQREIEGIVQFEPRRDVRVKSCSMHLRVQEITRRQEGTRTVTKEKTLLQRNVQDNCEAWIKAAKRFHSRLYLRNIPEHIPSTIEGHSYEIVWTIVVKIDIRDWFNWTRNIRLQVRNVMMWQNQ